MNYRRDNNRGSNRDYRDSRDRQYERPRDDYYDDRHRYRQGRGTNPLLWVLLGLGGIALAVGGYMFLGQANKVQITSVNPHYVTVQEPYNSCRNVKTTTYVANQKDGTKGAIIGGATGAVLGGVVGNQIKHGSGTAIGAVVGGIGGAVAGNQIEKSYEPDTVAKHGSKKECGTKYRSVKSQDGYDVQYLYKGTPATIITQNPPAVGSKIELEQLQAMALQR